MANYFSKFPKIYHKLDKDYSPLLVTDIVARWSFERSLKDNPNAYNASNYYYRIIEEGDTPEILAHKIYGSAELHWIILMYNDIVDPQWDWPLDYYTFNEYIKNKYGSIVEAQNQVQSYFKVETTELLAPVSIINDRNRYTVNRIPISKSSYSDECPESYDTLIQGTQGPFYLPDGTTVQVTITKEMVSCYDYENELNERKRKIKILKPEFAPSVVRELQNIFS